MPRPKLGAPYKFAPEGFLATECSTINGKPVVTQLTGKIVYINDAHRYFTAEAHVGRAVIRESFKF